MTSNPKLIEKFKKIHALHRPGDPFDAGPHFAAVSSLPPDEIPTYITWSAQLPAHEQPLARPRIPDPPMSREEYLIRLRHLEPWDLQSVASFRHHTQSHINGPPPGPLVLGFRGGSVYALDSGGSGGRVLMDERSVDPRGDFTLCQDLVRFKGSVGGGGGMLVGPRVGVCLGNLLLRRSGDSSSVGLENVVWEGNGCSVVLSAIDRSIWLLSSLESNGVWLPEDLQLKLEGKQRINGSKIFKDVKHMIQALEADGETELFQIPPLGENVVDGDVTWWVVRSEDLPGLHPKWALKIEAEEGDLESKIEKGALPIEGVGSSEKASEEKNAGHQVGIPKVESRSWRDMFKGVLRSKSRV